MGVVVDLCYGGLGLGKMGYVVVLCEIVVECVFIVVTMVVINMVVDMFQIFGIDE